MDKFTRILLLLLVFAVLPAIAQKEPIGNFKEVDAWAGTIKYKNNIAELVDQLVLPCKTDLEKARVIFYWITENIGYDYKFVNKKKKIRFPSCKKGQDCKKIFENWNNDFLAKVLRKEKTICHGYARLFHAMCKLANVRCEMVIGQVKTKPSQIGKLIKPNHVWNVIWIDGREYFVEPTWGAGYCQPGNGNKLVGFEKKRNEYYFLTPPDSLFRDHFPSEQGWLKSSTYSREIFRDNPYISNAVVHEIRLVQPLTGIVSAKAGQPIKLSFEYWGEGTTFQVNTNLEKSPKAWKIINEKFTLIDRALKKQKYADFKKEGNLRTYEVQIKDKRINYIEVLIDYLVVLKFKVKVTD